MKRSVRMSRMAAISRIFQCVKQLAIAGLILFAATATAAPKAPRAVVLVYADDLGFGDLSCYGASRLKTPNIDRLAEQGRVFTDAHSASAVCTPSRYSLLTGRYAWRVDNYNPVFAQHGLIIDPDTTTLADVFQQAGYTTACIGKWHLGFGDPHPNWNGELIPGPLELGFDYYYGVPVVNSHPPFVYVENHRVVGLVPEDPLIWRKNTGNPHTQAYPEKKKAPLRNGLGFRGGKAAHGLYVDEMVGTHLTDKALEWMDANKDKPFFLYFASTAIHHPFTPHPRFQGTSKAGRYGDFVHELDWITGRLMEKLEQIGVADDSIFIFTSDNGGMLNQGGRRAWELGHRLNAHLQGFKFDVWEGGHRVPFIIRWPGRVPAGSKSDALISSIDMTSTCADILGVKLPEHAAPDGISVLPELTGEPAQPCRDHLVLAGQSREHLSLRDADWVYIPAQGGGGFGNGLTGIKNTDNINSDITSDGRIKPGSPPSQLYNLKSDPRQQTNVIREHPEIAGKLKTKLDEVRNEYYAD